MKNLNDIINYNKPRLKSCGFKPDDNHFMSYHTLYMKDGSEYRSGAYLTDRFGVTLKDDFLYIYDRLDEYITIGDDPIQ